MDLYEQIVALRKEGRRAALATIVRRVGSTPRKDHAKMLIAEDGSACGSVGGGCVEAEVWQKARQVMDSGHSIIVRCELNEEDAASEGLVCGGTVEIFVEPILPDPSVILLGAGHVAQAVAEAVHRIGFRVSVLDDREAFANRQRFPQAEQIVVDDFEPGLRQIAVHPNSFILVVTRGHRHDQTALQQAVQTPAGYIGLIGSRRKIQMIVRNLLDQGLPLEQLQRLYAPIGLEIGSETPEEIAVSVAAELIALRKGVHQRSEKQRFILRLLDEAGRAEKQRSPA